LKLKLKIEIEIESDIDFFFFKVPRVFIKGKCIGGGNETSSLHKSKKLGNMLRDAGAIV
jgi:glutaredoxin-related protein